MENTPKKVNKNKYIIIGFIILLGFVIINGLRPYLSGFLGAITLYILTRGQLNHFVKKKKWNKAFVASMLTLESLLFFLLPLTMVAILAIDTISGLQIDTELLKLQFNQLVDAVEKRFGVQLFTPENISFVSKIGTGFLQSLASSTYSLVINLVIILFVLYYMFYQSDSLEHLVKDIMPFSESNKNILVHESKSIIQANAISIPLLAIIQGFFAYLGYMFFNVDNPVLYAVLTAFTSIIPMIGTMVVWVPITVTLILAGDLYNGIGLGLYGLIIIGGVDNVARFILQKKLADIHPLITVFGVLLGVPMFGFWGVIFGPLLLSLFILLINLYRFEYIPGSIADPRITEKSKNTKFNFNFFRRKKK